MITHHRDEPTCQFLEATKVGQSDEAIVIDKEEGGIVDGAHAAKIIEEANGEDTTPEEQYVEVYVPTGVTSELISDIARGLNTGIQVAPQSIYNIGGVFDWLKSEINGEPYADRLRHLLKDGQRLYDRIRHDFRLAAEQVSAHQGRDIPDSCGVPNLCRETPKVG